MNKSEFIDSIKAAALEGQRDFGILASLTLAQAILESSWGCSKLSLQANNLFGIKAFANWTGKRITLSTEEWHDGKKVTVNADFRAYDSRSESIADHARLLMGERYNPVRNCRDYKSACRSIYECGYATDPEYPKKLIAIIEQNKLYEFDSAVDINEAAAALEDERVRKFQHLCNVLNIKDFQGKPLKEDNVPGPRTRSCISKMPVLKLGSKGPAVVYLQEAVKAAPVDGIFGPITESSVKKFQKSKGLLTDGIVGPRTWSAIISI